MSVLMGTMYDTALSELPYTMTSGSPDRRPSNNPWRALGGVQCHWRKVTKGLIAVVGRQI